MHIDVLGWLYVLAGSSGLVSAAGLLILAFGTHAGLGGSPYPTGATSVIWLLVVSALALGGGGFLMIVAGRALLRRDARGRHATLLLALPTLVIVPFGTALSTYTFWALLNDDARREFGRPPRARWPPDAPSDAVD